MTPAETFEIEFTKPVTFRDWEGTVLKHYNVGDRCEATGFMTVNGANYFITPLGGIYDYEAKRVLK